MLHLRSLRHIEKITRHARQPNGNGELILTVFFTVLARHTANSKRGVHWNGADRNIFPALKDGAFLSRLRGLKTLSRGYNRDGQRTDVPGRV